MDSPQPSKSISTAASAVSANAVASSDSPVQESPFSSFLSNLSPINPVKPSHVPQGFLGLSSPPLIFTSPRATLHQRTSFLQRLQLSNISSLETPEKDDVRKNSDDLREPETYCRNLINDIQEDNNIKNNEQDQHVGCADEYLNYAEDFINSAKLIDQDVKQSNDALQSSISNLSNASSHVKGHSTAELDTSLALFEPIKEDPPGKSFNENKPTYFEEEQIDSIHPHESDLSVDRDPGINQCDIGTQENEEYVENMKTALQGSIQNVVQCDLEKLTRGVEGSKWCTFWKLRELRGHFESSEKQKVSQLQRGLSRRCLQFEEAGRKNYVRSIPSSNQRDSSLGSGSLASATDMESSNPPHVDLTASSNKKKMLNLSQLANSAYLPRSTRKSHTIVPKPSGIGLHLNSIALPTATSSHSSVVIIKSTPTMNSHHVENKGHSKKLPQLVDKAAIAPEDNMSEPLSSLAISAVNSEPCQSAKPLNKRNFNLENADNFEEFSQLSPTKKKRKTSMSADAGGCKRCNCKKTKCLKLYCDCFAAGIYCSEGCACQGCFNKPEYEATVMETRQLIESRNPLAFAPKVVQRVSEHTPLIKEDGSRTAPSLARHKRGCNCKKSMCLKKYCECYQANVGCSSGCRCEGCRNSYGRKEEYHSSEETLVNRVCKERYGVRDEHNSEMVTTKGLQAELHDTHSLTPSTPSFQHTDHGKDAAKSQLNPGRYLPSPESDFSNLPSHTRSIKSPSNDMIPEGNEEILDIDSFEQGMDYNVSEIMDQFSPGCNELSAICSFTPSQNSSTAANLAPSALSKTKESLGSSKFQLCSQSGHLSSGRSLRWRSSPITPMPELGETKNRKNDCDGGNFDILGDDTPEILKEDFTPIVSVKATSPNKKRVSPPHNHVRGLRPSSSVGLKSGRKFILTAISSSSSLTPCSQSSGKIDDKSSNN